MVRPLVELADWQLVDLDPGRSTKVTFKITADMFAYWDRDLTRRVDTGDVDVIIGPNAGPRQLGPHRHHRLSRRPSPAVRRRPWRSP